jgi:hypothetical protein
MLLLLLLPIAGADASEPPLILLSDTGTSYAAVRDAIETHYPGPVKTAALPSTGAKEATLIMAVGTRACERALFLATDKQRLICVYLPAATFYELTDAEKGHRLLGEKRLSALFLDQPFARQIRLGKLIRPQARSVGSAVGEAGSRQYDAFADAAADAGLTLRVARLGANDNPVEALTPVIEQSDFFVPIPDRSVFNRAAAKWILYITLRSQVPLIGFSASYADAGAVASLYSTPDQIARQCARMLTLAETTAELPPPQYPEQFSISVNRTAARNLRLQLPSTEILSAQLQAQEPER